MKPINIVVTGEPVSIKNLIKSISYGPDETITHKYRSTTDEAVSIKMNFGSLQVDEDYRIDFFGGTDPKLFEFVESRPSAVMNGMIIVLDAGQSADIDQLDQTINKHIKYLKKYAMVIGITGDDYTSIKQAEEQVRQTLHTFQSVAPVFSIDTEKKADVNLLVESLLCFGDPGIKENKVKNTPSKSKE